MSACPPIEAWEVLVTGRAPEADAAALQTHAKQCAPCRRVLADLTQNQGMLGELRAALAGRAESAAPAPLTGRQFGEYLIIKVLGSGGMATVYQAEQGHPKRTVALKVLARGLSSPAALARFRQEADVLGRLHHHGIAQVFGAGMADDGTRPYFAMELVRGRTLLEHAGGLDRRARLELLARVCDAVQYAHEHGVVHRDLKPSNIMVDEHGQPKVLDFGVARAVEPGDRTAALRTEPGQLVGTIAYMSPEQAGGAPEEIDARTDVYALGVVCYEMLSGRLPFDLRSASALDALRTVREQDPPRLGAIDRSLRGDLEVIVATATDKDRARRYPSAAALAADLRRYLDDAPIAARPATAFYYLRKFARRNRLLVAASAAVLAALLVGLAGTSYGLWRAERRRATAEAVSQLLESALRAANPHEVKGVGYTVRQLLDDLSRGLDVRLAGQPEVEGRIRATTGNAYRLLGDYPRARQHLEAALTLRKSVLGNEHPLVAASIRDLAWVRHDQGDYAAAEGLFGQALDMQRRILGERHVEVAATLHGISDVLRHTGAFDRAEPLARQALELRRSLLGEQHPDTAESLANLSKLARDRGDRPAAEQFLEQAITVWERAYGQDHPRLVDGLNDRAWLQYQRRDLGAAEETLTRALAMGRRLLGDQHPDVANTLYELGHVRDAAADAPGAEAHLREALARYRGAHGDAHPSVWSTLDALAQLIIRVRGDYAAAEPLAREALEGRRALFGEHGGETALSLNTMARMVKGAGRAEEAERLFGEAITALRAAYGPDHPYLAISQHDLGVLLEERRESARAEAAFREALRINTAAAGPSHANTILVATSLARLLNHERRFADAEALLAPLLGPARAGPRTWRLGATLESYGLSLRGLERPAEAEPILKEAEAVYSATLGPAHKRTLAVLDELASAYDAMHDARKSADVRADAAARRDRSGR